MKQYKVLSQKDKWFTGKFDPATLEQALNAYASQGWEVKEAVTASMPGMFNGNREELIVIMERTKPDANPAPARVSEQKTASNPPDGVYKL